jgi:hypothetical protein
VSKPLGGKAYGSIPHLPGSRRGPGDYGLSDQQAAICIDKARPGDDVIITVKLDGSNVSVARKDGQLLALGRAGHLAQSSPYEQHQRFADWVRRNEARFEDLPEGWWVSGEWLLQAHGTRYALRHHPFCPFDLIAGRNGQAMNRRPYDELMTFATQADLVTPTLLSRGPAVPIREIERALDVPMHGELDPVEGAVWRVETRGHFSFIAKYVRPEKRDGCYLTKETGLPDVWNVTVQPL